MKWTGTGLSVVLLVLTICSVPWVVRWNGQNGWWVGLIPLCLELGHQSSPRAGSVGWNAYLIGSDWTPFLHFEYNTQDRYWATSLTGVLSGKVSSIAGVRYWYVRVPTYALLLPVLLATSFVWRLDRIARRRAHVGSCARCGYDLSATPSDSICPECGSSRGNTPTNK